jgi:RNA-directed DNA polymerase
MNGPEQSDRLVVPVKPPNKAAAAEVVEGRGLRVGNAASKTRPGHRAGQGGSGRLQWPHDGRLKWTHLASVVVVG